MNLIKHQLSDADKNYLYVKTPLKSKYPLLINGREKVGIKHEKYSKVFLDYSQSSIHKVVFDHMKADMESNKKLKPTVVELFLRGRRINISVDFISQSYSKVPKNIKLNGTHYFVMKICNKRKLQPRALNHSSDIDFKDFTKLYKDYTKETFSFLKNNTTLPLDNPLRLKKNLHKTTVNEKIKTVS